MKQNDLAKQLGVTQAYISKFINGHTGCSLKTARRLTDLFGHDPLFWMEATPEEIKSIIGNGNNGSKKTE